VAVVVVVMLLLLLDQDKQAGVTMTKTFLTATIHQPQYMHSAR